MSSVEEGSGGNDRTIVPVMRRPSEYPLAPTAEMLAVAPAAGPAPAAHLLRRILEHKWTILLVALLVSVPGCVLVLLLVKPQFKAEGQIEIRPVIQPLVYDLGGRGSDSSPYYHEFVFTQVTIMRGPTVLNRVLDANEVRSTHWYRDSLQRGVQPSVDALREVLTVQPAGRTTLIDVSAMTERPSDAVTLVRTVLDKYIAFYNESESEDSASRNQQLTVEKANLEASIHEAERQIDFLRSELGTTNPDELVAAQRKRVDEMQAKKDELDRTIKLSEFDVNQGRLRLSLPTLDEVPLTSQPTIDSAVVQAAASQPGSTPGARDPLLIYGEDVQWRTLDNDVRAKQQELMIMRRSLGPSHPDIRALEDRIRLVQANRDTRQTQLDQEVSGVASGMGHSVLGESTVIGSRSSMARDLETKQETLRRLGYEQKLLKEDLAKQQSNTSNSFDRAETLRAHLRELTSKQEMYAKVRATLERRHFEQHVPGLVQILAYPYLPDRPLASRRMFLSVAMLLLGLGAGVGAAFLRVKSNPNIQGVGELTQSAAVPFLGQLPMVRAADGHALLDDPLLNEGIRMVRTPLLQRMDRAAAVSRKAGIAPGSIVLITSAGPGDGKTTVSVLLARSLANCGRRVLLVDADLRNPSLAGLLNLESQRGLMDVLVGEKSQQEHYIQRTDVERLSVLPAGNVTAMADPELIANGKFSAAMNRWREQYDVVLLDSPPVLPVADARILACAADGVVLVVRARQNQREEVIEAVHHLESAGGSLWGTVLISAGSRQYGYGSKYSYGYGYGARA
jgi:polysaccharide biosynthesis transport protein